MRRSKRWMISRSKCARCGQIGHWAKHCTNTPDARGAAHPASKGAPKKKLGLAGFTAGFCVAGDPPLPIEDQKREDGEPQYMHPSFIAVDITIFIGLEVTLGHALIDTGAQHGVVGIELFKHLYDF